MYEHCHCRSSRSTSSLRCCSPSRPTSRAGADATVGMLTAIIGLLACSVWPLVLMGIAIAAASNPGRYAGIREPK